MRQNYVREPEIIGTPMNIYEIAELAALLKRHGLSNQLRIHATHTRLHTTLIRDRNTELSQTQQAEGEH